MIFSFLCVFEAVQLSIYIQINAINTHLYVIPAAADLLHQQKEDISYTLLYDLNTPFGYKQSLIAHFAIVTKNGLFWLNIVMSSQKISDEQEALALCSHICRLFLHTEIGVKAIITSK